MLSFLANTVGTRGVSGWHVISQDQVQRHADLSGDGADEWLHLDPEQAAIKAPHGGTIVQGFLQVSHLVKLCGEAMRSLEGIDMNHALNYGFDRLRFVNPLPVGTQFRAEVTVAAVNPHPRGGYVLKEHVALVMPNGNKTLVADWLFYLEPEALNSVARPAIATPTTAMPRFGRIDNYLSHYAQVQPNTPAWIDSGRSISFAQADRWVNKIARALLVNGVKKGDRISVFGKSSAEFIALFLAITSLGAIYVGLNPKYTQHELTAQLTDALPVMIFNILSDGESASLNLQAACSHMSVMPKVVSLAQLDSFEKSGDRALDETLSKLTIARSAVNPKDVALLVYTSGSTGSPKGAQLTHLGITTIAAIVNDPIHFGVQGQGRTLCNLPINHVGCVVDLCTNSIAWGTTLIFQPDFDAELALKAIEEHQLTLLAGVPAMFLMISRSPLFLTINYSSLQKVVLAGNASPLPLVRELTSVMKVPIVNGYGLTEAMGFSTFTQLGDSPEVVANTIGRFDPRIE